MKRLILLAVLIPTMALAKSPFDGTWKTNLDSIQVSGNPDNYELIDGFYDCKSCAPPYKIKADGSDQPVPKHDYLDHEAVKILSPSTVEFTDKQAGKVMNTTTMTVSDNGSRLTVKFKSNVGEKPFEGTLPEKRLGPGAAGAHALSGTWRQDAVSDVSDAARTVVLQSTRNGLKMLWNGQTTDALFDGKEYATVGDPGKTMVSLKKISDSKIEETDRRQGKIFDVVVWTVAADGKTLTVVDTDPVHGTKTTSTAEKQL